MNASSCSSTSHPSVSAHQSARPWGSEVSTTTWKLIGMPGRRGGHPTTGSRGCHRTAQRGHRRARPGAARATAVRVRSRRSVRNAHVLHGDAAYARRMSPLRRGAAVAVALLLTTAAAVAPASAEDAGTTEAGRLRPGRERGHLHAIDPVRVVDTRNGTGGRLGNRWASRRHDVRPLPRRRDPDHGGLRGAAQRHGHRAHRGDPRPGLAHGHPAARHLLGQPRAPGRAAPTRSWCRSAPTARSPCSTTRAART